MNAMPKLRPDPMPEDPYKAPPENETLRQYFERCGYLGSFDDLSDLALRDLEQEFQASKAILETARTNPVVFMQDNKIYKRYPDGTVEFLRHG